MGRDSEQWVALNQHYPGIAEALQVGKELGVLQRGIWGGIDWLADMGREPRAVGAPLNTELCPGIPEAHPVGNWGGSGSQAQRCMAGC